jgi:hypothetical protein
MQYGLTNRDPHATGHENESGVDIYFHRFSELGSFQRNCLSFNSLSYAMLKLVPVFQGPMYFFEYLQLLNLVVYINLVAIFLFVYHHIRNEESQRPAIETQHPSLQQKPWVPRHRVRKSVSANSLHNINKPFSIGHGIV